jgi:hypothetical protein
MNEFKSPNEQVTDDKLFEGFLSEYKNMSIDNAIKKMEKMTDEGLYKATFKIEQLIEIDPGYMVLNTLVFGEFTKRPHLRNPFL